MIPRIGLLLRVGMACLVSPCEAGVRETRLVGTWRATDDRLTMTLVLRTDHRATWDIALDFDTGVAQSSRALAGVWELRENHLVCTWTQGQPVRRPILKLSRDTLALADEERTITFRRIKSAAETDASNEGMPAVLHPTDTRTKPVVLSELSVILTPWHASNVISRGLKEPEPKLTGYWMPKYEHVRELEERLPAFMREQTPIRRPILHDFRQYAGFKAGKKRFIFINAFCVEGGRVEPHWKLRGVVWGGGGDCVWWAEYRCRDEAVRPIPARRASLTPPVHPHCFRARVE